MYLTLIFLLLGLIVGSFLNVVILRHNTGRTLSGRSGCLSCGRKLKWYELLPVLSFIIQKGRCRGCQAKISWQYPIVELSTAILFALIYCLIGWQIWLLIIYWLIACLLVIITAYDFKHQIIPDRFVFAFIALGLIKVIFSDAVIWWGLVGGLTTSLPLFLLWAVSRGRWLGFGDVKLALGIGLLLGVTAGLSALMLAFWIGAGIGLILIGWGKTQLWRKGKSYTMKSEIPFAPFLILGFWLVFFLSIDVLAFWQI